MERRLHCKEFTKARYKNSIANQQLLEAAKNQSRKVKSKPKEDISTFQNVPTK